MSLKLTDNVTKQELNLRCFFILFCFKKIFFLRERDRKRRRQRAQAGDGQKEKQTPYWAGSQNPGIMTWAERSHSTNWATQAPQIFVVLNNWNRWLFIPEAWLSLKKQHLMVTATYKYFISCMICGLAVQRSCFGVCHGSSFWSSSLCKATFIQFLLLTDTRDLQ